MLQPLGALGHGQLELVVQHVAHVKGVGEVPVAVARLRVRLLLQLRQRLTKGAHHRLVVGGASQAAAAASSAARVPALAPAPSTGTSAGSSCGTRRRRPPLSPPRHHRPAAAAGGSAVRGAPPLPRAPSVGGCTVPVLPLPAGTPPCSRASSGPCRRGTPTVCPGATSTPPRTRRCSPRQCAPGRRSRRGTSPPRPAAARPPTESRRGATAASADRTSPSAGPPARARGESPAAAATRPPRAPQPASRRGRRRPGARTAPAGPDAASAPQCLAHPARPPGRRRHAPLARRRALGRPQGPAGHTARAVDRARRLACTGRTRTPRMRSTAPESPQSSGVGPPPAYGPRRRALAGRRAATT
eukprot:scaffold3830_cov324-Prasinococcus_capsulatus_cf.AAC.6